jgi:hypothetical protein
MSLATIDHDTIRKWAEAKGGKPAAVTRTHEGGDVGIIRLMFPKNPQSEHDSLVEISWDEFFDQFEKSKLALVYEEDSLFSKIIGRDTLERREHGEHASRHHPAGSHSRNAEKPASSSKASSGRKQAASKESDDLKAREYRDAQGNIHHHTRTSQQHR